MRNRRRDGGFPRFLESGRESSTLAVWLRRAGYRTLLAGKYLNWYPRKAGDPAYVPPGWSDWAGLYSREDYLGFTLNDDGRLVKYGAAPEDYQTDVLRARVDRFLTEVGETREPFFIYLAPYAPHGPAWPAARHAHALPGLSAPRTPAFDEDTSDKSQWLRDRPPLSPEAVARIDDLFRRRVRTLLAVDELLASLLERLQQIGALDSTFVLFTSDNGFHLGSHRREHGKADPYDESIRVPFLVRGPGVAAGQRVDALVLNLDLAPTLLELAGLSPPDPIDGRSLVPLLSGSEPGDWRSDALIEGWPNYAESVPAYSALRSRELLFVEYGTKERELYDLRRDPYQLENRIDTASSEQVDELAARLAALRGCAGASCRE
jgi:arylsulfatase A-like enzyme